MAAPAIVVKHLSKQYSIGQSPARHDTLRDTLVGIGRSLHRSARLQAGAASIWALQDVSFEIPHGQVIGIIGRNGAGKSTLLKILSQITEPTSGLALINGRVGSLLEIGTGFHPELTGRENIYLYGAILGMQRAEIVRKFDEIVAFAEIEKFLDTPVKRYSSGMYVRLAFAVAAQLEPEILLVDEVLAVGDTEFQKRCLGKMDDVASSGRTVLFVSHNLNIIQRLCNQTLLLDRGVLVDFAPTQAIIQRYIDTGQVLEKPGAWIDLRRAQELAKPYFTHIWYRRGIQGGQVQPAAYPVPEGSLEFRLKIFSDSIHRVNSLAVTLYDQNGTKLVNADTLNHGIQLTLDEGLNQFSLAIDQLHLNPGIYRVGLWMANPPVHVYDRVDDAIKIEVFDHETALSGRRPLEDGVVVNQFSIQKIALE